MRILSGSSEGDIRDVSRPLIAVAVDVTDPHRIPDHSHARGQFVYAVTGAMHVAVEGGTWHASPRVGVWIPAGRRHAVVANGSLAYRSLYVDAQTSSSLPTGAGPMEVTPLMRELILRAAEFGGRYGPDTPESRLIAVLHDEMRTMKIAPSPIPMPRDARLLRLATALLANPGYDRSLAEWGRIVGASGRTLARLFRRETGLSFARWRERVRLATAIDRLLAGESVTAVAFDVGYTSPSAFTAMFHRTLGESPRRYLKRLS